MQDLHEQIRKYHEHVIARSGRAMRYWEKVPPLRTCDELVQRAQKLVEAMTGKGGSTQEAALDLGFLCFIMFTKGAEISSVMTKLQKTQSTESVAEEVDPEREEWERKRKKEAGNEDWRG